MIDLTPLDVRNKRGDFKKGMRGYDPQEVDVFLELVAERLEALVRENIQLRDRTDSLQDQVDAQAGREQAVQDALVTAQELRKDIREQSQREADHVMREAESEARRLVAEAEAEVRSKLRGVERQMDHARDSLQELERRRARFLQDFRTMLRRELDFVEVEEERTFLEERVIDLELGPRRRSMGKGGEEEEQAAATTSGDSVEPKSDRAEIGPEDPAEGLGGSPSDTAAASEAGAVSEEDDEPGEASAKGSTPRSEGPVDGRPTAPPPEVGDQPSSLELELMAGAAGASGDEAGSGSKRIGFGEVPDLETVLAEAGIDEVSIDEPRADHEEISPPPADRRPEDRLALFEKDEKKKKKR